MTIPEKKDLTPKKDPTKSLAWMKLLPDHKEEILILCRQHGIDKKTKFNKPFQTETGHLPGRNYTAELELNSIILKKLGVRGPMLRSTDLMQIYNSSKESNSQFIKELKNLLDNLFEIRRAAIEIINQEKINDRRTIT